MGIESFSPFGLLGSLAVFDIESDARYLRR